ncbi:hypothetical protein PENTCL1PPCAC_4833, partial [Pristionchus entomophagus]
DAMRPQLLLLAAHLFLSARSSLDESALFVRVLAPAHLAYTYEIIPARFGPPLDAYRHTAWGVRLLAATIEESCNGLADDATGYVVIMPRGECSFVEKVAHAAAAGARFALVTEVNSSSSATISMSRGEVDADIHIPSAYMAGTSGSRLHRFLSFSNEPVLVDIPINATDVGILLDKAPWEIW